MNARTLILGLLLSACAVAPSAPPEVRHTLAPSGKLRVGVYVDSPLSYIRNSTTGEANGVGFEVGRELAKRLGVPFELKEYPRAAEVLVAIKAGEVDYTVTNATAVRAKDMDFTATLLVLELGYLVPAGSAASSIADLDRPGGRIGVTQGSTTQSTLPGRLKNATIVPAASMKSAIEMLQQRSVDAFATNKPNLFQMSDSVPGSRVLDGNWGGEHIAIAIPKGREQAMPWLQKFAADVKSEGLVSGAVARAGLRGSVQP